MSNVSQWATAAAGNNAQPPDGAPEGMAPSTVNNWGREVMAAVARWYEEAGAKLTTGGVADTYTLSTNSAHAALADLPALLCIIHATNTGPSTIDVDNIGAKAIVLPDGSALPAGALQQNAAVLVAYVAAADVYVLVGGRSLGTVSSRDVGTANGQVPAAEDAGILGREGTWTRQQRFAPDTLTDAANISWDLELAQVARVTLTADRTLANPTNMRDGAMYLLHVRQDATGGHSLSFGSAYDFGAAGVPGLTQTANRSDVLTFFSDGTKMMFTGIQRGYDES